MARSQRWRVGVARGVALQVLAAATMACALGQLPVALGLVDCTAAAGCAGRGVSCSGACGSCRPDSSACSLCNRTGCGALSTSGGSCSFCQCTCSAVPTQRPTRPPTRAPTRSPTRAPTRSPTLPPSRAPALPTQAPTPPTSAPSTLSPTPRPTPLPSPSPTTTPTEEPTASPTARPTSVPTPTQTASTAAPSAVPTTLPTIDLTALPSHTPTRAPADPQVTEPPVVAPTPLIYPPTTVQPSPAVNLGIRLSTGATSGPTADPTKTPTAVPTSGASTSDSSDGGGDSSSIIITIAVAMLCIIVGAVVTYARRRSAKVATRDPAGNVTVNPLFPSGGNPAPTNDPAPYTPLSGPHMVYANLTGQKRQSRSAAASGSAEASVSTQYATLDRADGDVGGPKPHTAHYSTLARRSASAAPEAAYADTHPGNPPTAPSGDYMAVAGHYGAAGAVSGGNQYAVLFGDLARSSSSTEHDSTRAGSNTSPTPGITYAAPHPGNPPPTVASGAYMLLAMQYGAQGASVMGGGSVYAALAPRGAGAGEPTYEEPEPGFGFDAPTE